ncbi:MAG: redoxin domain-containing protein [Lachnospiraceae bacterium]|nr:redoxin domain-containing protein [Lachnospiraceae bacterium]
MKKTLLLTILFIGIFVSAIFIYNNLSEKYDPAKVKPQGTFSDKNTEITNSFNEFDTSQRTPAPDFTVTDNTGASVNLSDFFGKPIIINFWATWCEPCKSELPTFDTLYQEYGEDVHFLMINLTDNATDTVRKVKAFVEQQGYSFPVYYDTELNVALTYYIPSIPRTLFLDKQGNILEEYIGAMSETTLRNYIESLLD